MLVIPFVRGEQLGITREGLASCNGISARYDGCPISAVICG